MNINDERTPHFHIKQIFPSRIYFSLAWLRVMASYHQATFPNDQDLEGWGELPPIAKWGCAALQGPFWKASFPKIECDFIKFP